MEVTRRCPTGPHRSSSTGLASTIPEEPGTSSLAEPTSPGTRGPGTWPGSPRARLGRTGPGGELWHLLGFCAVASSVSGAQRQFTLRVEVFLSLRSSLCKAGHWAVTHERPAPRLSELYAVYTVWQTKTSAFTGDKLHISLSIYDSFSYLLTKSLSFYVN